MSNQPQLAKTSHLKLAQHFLVSTTCQTHTFASTIHHKRYNPMVNEHYLVKCHLCPGSGNLKLIDGNNIETST